MIEEKIIRTKDANGEAYDHTLEGKLSLLITKFGYNHKLHHEQIAEWLARYSAKILARANGKRKFKKASE